MTTTLETWMPEARQMAAQCWCDDETIDEALGEAAKTRDDGNKSEDVLCAKVPELVEALVANIYSTK